MIISYVANNGRNLVSEQSVLMPPVYWNWRHSIYLRLRWLTALLQIRIIMLIQLFKFAARVSVPATYFEAYFIIKTAHRDQIRMRTAWMKSAGCAQWLYLFGVRRGKLMYLWMPNEYGGRIVDVSVMHVVDQKRYTIFHILDELVIFISK